MKIFNDKKNGIHLFAHFRNEEYLLPWWCEHHKNKFDGATLLNYKSTDRSVEIIKDICPNWKIVDTENSHFVFKPADQEIMYHEAKVKNKFKICLNVTEFILFKKDFLQKLIKLDNDLKEQFIFEFNLGIKRYTMADENPKSLPTYDDALVNQKTWGFTGHNPYNFDYRFLHNGVTGQYSQGRHVSRFEDSKFASEKKLTVDVSDAVILWYGYSPWNKQNIDRKLRVKEIVHDKQFEMGQGIYHLFNEDSMFDAYNAFYRRSVDLKKHIIKLS